MHRAIITQRAPRDLWRSAFPGAGLDSLLTDLWRAPVSPAASTGTAAGFVPRLDAVETEHEYRLAIELPGLTDDDFSLEIEEGVLALEGHKHGRHESIDEGSSVWRVETLAGRFERRVRFDGPVDEDGVTASFKNGVLEVVVPKREESKPESRSIDVTSA